MIEHDPLRVWRMTMEQTLTEAGRVLLGSLGIGPSVPVRDRNPYIAYHPTTPRPRMCAATGLSKKELKRAIARAYATEHLCAWVPYWMHAAIYPNGNEWSSDINAPEIPRDLRLTKKAISAFRFDATDPIQLTSARTTPPPAASPATPARP